MREKTEKILITFKSGTDATAMDKVCRDIGIKGRTVPVPRNISASCGQCWISDVINKDEVTDILEKKSLAYEDIYFQKMF